MTGTPRRTDEGLSAAEPARPSPEEKRALLRRLLEQRAREPKTSPLSFAQERLWFLDQLAPGTPLFNIAAAIGIGGQLDLAAAERSLNEMVRRHETLRTTFMTMDGQPVQVIAPALTLPLPVLDLRHLPGAQCEAEVRRLMVEEARRPFDLARGPLLRLSLVRMADDDHMMLITMHHIISDGWSVGVFIREALALYYAFSTQAALSLPELSIQYSDFAKWQRQELQGTTLPAQLAYWKQKLANLTVLDIPTDRPRPPVLSSRGATCLFTVPANVSQRLRDLSRRENATLFMTLLAAFQTLLYRYSGQDDIVVGTAVSGRNRAELEGLIGCFVNAVVMRTDFSGNPTFQQLLRQVRQVALDAYAHEDVPFEKVVQELRPRRDSSRTPLFQVMFVLRATPAPPPRALGFTLSVTEVDPGASEFDLTLSMTDGPDGLLGTFEYSTDLFDAPTIGRMVGHFQRILETAGADPDQTIGRLPIMTDAELRQQLIEWNDTRVDDGSFPCVHQLIEAQVELTPDAIAVIAGDQHLTYREVNRRANQLAHHLQALGVGPDVCVGVWMERSPELVITLLGILKAGGAYLPLDPAYPRERLAYMLRDAQVPIVLTQAGLQNGLPDEAARVICVDATFAPPGAMSDANPAGPVGAENLAYVIYTSGSTGRPKGVQIPHRALSNHAQAMAREFGLVSRDRALQFATFSFDTAAEELFPTWLRGAVLVLRPPNGLSGPELVRLIEQEQLTVVNLPTAYWHQWVHELTVLPRPLPSSVRLVVVGGEQASAERLAAWRQLTRDRIIRWINGYGPTETTITATTWEPARGAESDRRGRTVPIGRPIANVQAYILDPHLQPVPIGVLGELYIGGIGLARGYLNQPELTAARFIPHPFSRDGDQRLYKTGDRARYLPDGQIELLGRVDDQIKIRGIRIEPGEIEATLARHPAVRDTVVVVREHTLDDKRLMAYLVTSQPAPTPNELRSFLRRTLPEHSVPSGFVLLDALPLMPNGKVDRQALPAPELPYVDRERLFVAPRTPVEVALAKIWGEVLGAEHVGVHDNFFELGGHSLLTLQLLFRVRETFDVDVPLTAMMQEPTVAGLAAVIDAVRQGSPTPTGERLDLEAEAVLDPTMMPAPQTAPPTSEAARVFVTGASGYVGTFLLGELLRQTQADVYCLVRAASKDDASKRLHDALLAAGLWSPTWHSRIVPVVGDLARPQLGLLPADFRLLGEAMDAVYHCGAQVNFLYPYTALKATNVLGTAEVLKLASQGRQTPVHYISTVSVFPFDPSRSAAIREIEQPAHGQGLHGGYAQSKWVAERLVTIAGSRGFPVSIYRLGLVTGSLGTGFVNEDDLAGMLLRACIVLGSAPDLEITVEMVPVDYVSMAVVHLSRQPDAIGRTFHLTNPRPAPAGTVIDWIDGWGYPLRRVSYAEWIARLRSMATSNRPELLFLSRMLGDRLDPSLRTPEFDCRDTLEALAGSSIACPPVDAKLIGTYLSAFVRSGLLEAPVDGNRQHG